MFLIKVTTQTIDQVVAHSKYASGGIPKKAKIGDIILIALTNINKGEKSIRFIMRYGGFYEDYQGESEELWGKKWTYIIKGTDLQSVEPFNMEDVQKRERPYRFNMGNYLYVEEVDEVAVLDWIYDRERYAVVYPDEESSNLQGHTEGMKKTVTVNVYERNPIARQLCIEHYGATCYCCDFNFGKTYGAKFEGKIHVHHRKKVSETDGEYQVNPIDDLVPVCPNCHMVLHSKRVGCYSVDDVKAMLKGQGQRAGQAGVHQPENV